MGLFTMVFTLMGLSGDVYLGTPDNPSNFDARQYRFNATK
jgi:hypothetical protein